MAIGNRSRLLAVILACYWFWGLAPTVWSRTGACERALDEFHREHYQEALELFSAERQRCPKSVLLRYKGLSLYHLFQYDKAVELLERALREEGKTRDVLRALTAIYLAESDYSKARRYADELIASEGADAKDYFLAGKVYQAEGDSDEAFTLYQKAVSLDPSSDAALELARMLLQEGRGEDAQKILERADSSETDPLTTARVRALRADMTETQRQYSITLGYRYEYDSNAILEPNAPDILTDSDRKSDQRHVLTADILADSPRWRNFQLFGEAHLSSSWYHHISELDAFVQNYVAGIGWSSSGGGYGLRLPFDYTHAIVNNDSYLDDYAINPGVYVRILSATLYGFMRFSWQDYHNQDVADEEDRDGNTKVLGMLGLVPFYNDRGMLRIIAQGSRVDTDGRNWDRDQVMVYSNLSFDFFSWFGVNAGFQFDQLYFDNTNLLYLKERDDTATTLFAGMVVRPYRNWAVRLQYSYVDWDSNIPLYKYYRNVVSLGISWNY